MPEHMEDGLITWTQRGRTALGRREHPARRRDFAERLRSAHGITLRSALGR
ncbi:hypothetical protein ACFVT6_10135 [Streptomyces sp. NPDC058049]|uniref:hypothetical protein n=1 Tax=Streptomyces sp. NPDC058049 TaxID=3346314 RepID=UPI0036E398D3